MSKHELGFNDLISKKRRLSLGLMGVVFAGLGIVVTFVSYTSGLLLFLLGMAIPFIMIYSIASKKFSRVVRMEVIDNVPRVNIEFWDKDKVEALPREFFWRYKNKYIPVIDETNGSQNWFDPFTNERVPSISSGDLFRTLNQESARILMQSNQNQWSEVAKIGFLGLLALGIGLYLIVVINQDDGSNPAMTDTPIPPPVIESVPDNLQNTPQIQPQGQNIIMPLLRSEIKNYGHRSKEIW